MFHTILVPLDGTSFGEQALPAAMAIARTMGAEVHLAHVYRPATPNELWLSVANDPDGHDAARQSLKEIAHEMYAAGVATDFALLKGPVVDALRDYIEEKKVDLVVMATHGRGPLSRVVLGSVAEPLVHSLSIPMLLVRPDEQPVGHGRPSPVRHLLIALDGSPTAEAMLPTAVDLGQAMGARFTLLRVVPPVTSYEAGPSGLMVYYMNDESTRRLQAMAADYLEHVADPLREKGLNVATRVVIHPDPATAIIEEAHVLGCDLIALESHSRAGLARLILGSVTDSVVHGTATPVLTQSSMND